MEILLLQFQRRCVFRAAVASRLTPLLQQRPSSRFPCFCRSGVSREAGTSAEHSACATSADQLNAGSCHFWVALASRFTPLPQKKSVSAAAGWWRLCRNLHVSALTHPHSHTQPEIPAHRAFAHENACPIALHTAAQPQQSKNSFTRDSNHDSNVKVL